MKEHKTRCDYFSRKLTITTSVAGSGVDNSGGDWETLLGNSGAPKRLDCNENLYYDGPDTFWDHKDRTYPDNPGKRCTRGRDCRLPCCEVECLDSADKKEKHTGLKCNGENKYYYRWICY